MDHWLLGIGSAFPREVLSQKIDDEEMKRAVLGLSQFLSENKNHDSLQGLRTQLENLVESDFGRLLCSRGPGIDLFQCFQQRKIVVILLDSRRYGESARAVGKLILQDLKEYTKQIQDHGLLLGRTATGLGTEKMVEQFLVHPNILKTLRVGECAFITKYPKSEVSVLKVDPAPKCRFENEASFSTAVRRINSCEESEGTDRVPLDLQHGVPPPKIADKTAKESKGQGNFWSDDSDNF